MRDRIETNSAQSYVGWYYELDRNLLEPPPPAKPRQGWRPLAQSQKVLSDLFESHMGGLVKEGRQSEIDRWMDELLEKNAAEIKSRANALELEHRKKSRETRGESRKRSREENAFEEGREIGENTVSLSPLRQTYTDSTFLNRSRHQTPTCLAAHTMSSRDSTDERSSSLAMGRSNRCRRQMALPLRIGQHDRRLRSWSEANFSSRCHHYQPPRVSRLE